MISLEQWRSAIGVFSCTHPPLIRMNWNTVQQEEQISTTSWYAIATVGLLLFSNSLIFITAMLLMCSGDVELNPGPVNCKKCPSCQLTTVPVKRRVCPCGHIFRKKSYRQPPKCLFPVTTSQPATSQKEVVTTRKGTTMTSSPFVAQTQSQPVVGKPPTTKGTANVTSAKGNDNDTVTPAVSNDTVTPSEGDGDAYDTVINVVMDGVRDDTTTTTTISPAQLQSQPVRISAPEGNNVVTAESVILPQPQSQPVIGQLSTSQQRWEKYKHGINKARRQKYRSNPVPEKDRVRKAYSLDPSPVRAMKREKYRCDPSPVRASKRKKYRSHPTPVKERVRQAYSLDPSPVRAMKREKYRSNPTPVKERVRLAYSLDPSPVRAMKREKYRSNPTPVKERVRLAYGLDPSPVRARKRTKYRDNPSPFKERARATYRLNPSLKRIRSTVAYRYDHEGIKFKRRVTYKFYRQNLIDKRSLDKLLACAVSKKYKKLPDNFKKYSSSMMRNITRSKFTPNDLETKHLIKSCMYFRDTNHKKFISAFRKLKLSALATLSKLHETSEDPVEILLGPSLHTASSESFFPSSTYHDAALDTDGNVIVSKFPVIDVGSMQKHWTCVPNLCKLDSNIVTSEAVCTIYESIGECDPIRARYYIQHIDDCDHQESHDPSLAGHSKSCHVDPNACNSKLLYLRRLAPHFPNIRTLVSMIYNVRRSDSQLCRIDQGLQTGNIELLQTIAAEEKGAYHGSSESSSSVVDESIILKTYMNAFFAYKNRCSELAEFPCLSCTKLCFKRECVFLDRCKQPVTGNAWNSFIQYLDSHPAPDDSLTTGYICKFCIGTILFLLGAC